MEVSVIGLGRFGSLWAKILSKKADVKGYNRSPGKELDKKVRMVDFAEAASSDAIFLCVAISAMEEVLEKLKDYVRPGSTVIDTCSVKVLPVNHMCRILPLDVQVLGSHPMFGPDSAASGLNGLPMILTPARIGDSELESWKEFFTSLGLNVITMSPDEHDHEAAFTQGITHFIGRVLADLELEQSRISTLGYRKLLEVMEQTCNDPWQLFLDLQKCNPYTDEMRKRLASSLYKLLSTLEN